MLLLLTNSLDGSSDIICRLCDEAALGCFRFNTDLYTHYHLDWQASGFAITDPTGRTVRSDAVTAAYWRKPHFPNGAAVKLAGASASEAEWAEAQVMYLTREVANWCRRRGLLRLVEPGAERRLGKVSQMLLAGRYLPVPPWQTGWGTPLQTGARIVKSLEGRLIDDGRFLYARRVDPARLDPRFPWLVQDPAPGAFDATVAFVHGACFGFRFAAPRDGTRDDWRTAINTDACVWEPWPLPAALAGSIRAFMAAAELKFGRLDFVIGADGEWFLEVNPNGQYGWLDAPDLFLHRAVLKALLDPDASIR